MEMKWTGKVKTKVKVSKRGEGREREGIWKVVKIGTQGINQAIRGKNYVKR